MTCTHFCCVSTWQMQFYTKFSLPCTCACTWTQCDLFSLCLPPTCRVRCLSFPPLSPLSHSTATLALADLIKGHARVIKSFSLLSLLRLELQEKHKISQLPIDLISNRRDATGLFNTSPPPYLTDTGLQKTLITHP